MAEHKFTRTEMLIGKERLRALRQARVILFGVGGVGSWCAEALVRSGIGKLTVVDSDAVSVTNINRQLQATPLTVGLPKAEEIARRLREINSDAEITAIQKTYNRDTKHEFSINEYDYVIDAIDSLSSKVDLIMMASALGATVFSALGAACRMDPTRVRVSSIWKSDKCKLGRFVRKRLRRWGFKGDFLCVWSDESGFADPEPKTDQNDHVSNVSIDDNITGNAERAGNVGSNMDINAPTNKTVNGSMVHVTGVFGFTLAGLVVQDLVNRCQ